ncbi:hypothetical protein B7R54_07435 [Subtercola boreus]|uniref:Uncharacterized protein n=1 Tax=Subtercola boreus TaxID=120213 RepID=A0A3E0VGK5_9MICO|nr:hypothetical protein B7R54_07435 [Subtercola boreus]TQL53922.1 hypothetical protein FB464_1441 [Subtercola boreus]
MIVGRVGRRFTNALTMTFVDAPGDPVATVRQGGAGGFGGRFAIALGLRNHGPGRHLMQTREGERVVTASGYNSPSTIERRGSTVATVSCGATTTVTGAGGVVLYTIEPDPDRASTADVRRMLVRGDGGATVARVDVILASSGWDISPGEVLGFGLALATEGLGALVSEGTPRGGSLPIRILGTRLVLVGPVAEEQRDLLLGLCVDLAVGGRQYVAAA